MKLQELISPIFNSLFLGFGLSVILILILSLLKSESIREFTSKFIHYAKVVIRVLAIIYFVLYLISTILYFNSNKVTAFSVRATGPYAWAYWIMLLRPFIFCGLAQLFWIKRIKNSRKATLILAVLIFVITLASGVNFERFVILVTSIHRDYLPSNWEVDNSVYDFGLLFILVIIKNILLFSALVFATWFLSERTKKSQITNRKS